MVSGQTHHVEGIGSQGQRLDNQANNQLDEEEDDIDGQHDADPRRL